VEDACAKAARLGPEVGSFSFNYSPEGNVALKIMHGIVSSSVSSSNKAYNSFQSKERIVWI